MSYFVYRSLTPGENRIRLVHVRPEKAYMPSEKVADPMDQEQSDINASESSNKVFCTFSHVSLDDAPPYTALSYTWGDLTQKIPILIDGTTSMVTENLECALRHLRRPDEEITLWIDALCIDQDDEAEKTEQVQQMRQIYSRAISVLAWLGPAAENSDIAMQWIKEFGARSAKLGIGTSAELRLRYLYQAVEKDLADKGQAYKQFIEDLKAQLSQSNRQYTIIISALRSFFKRPYWRRIWVVQELVTATKASFICGTKTMTENELHYGLRLLRNFGHYRLLESSQDAKFTPTDSTEGDSITSIDTRRPINLLKIRRATTPSPLIHLLRSFRESRATDNRDKVFALCGIAEDGQVLALRPNYSKSCGEVYINTAQALIQEGYIEILSLCEFAQRMAELPSWVPDWSHETGRSHLQQRSRNRASNLPATIIQPDFSASGSHQFPGNQVFSSRGDHLITLSLSATLIDTVQSLGSAWVDGGTGRWLCDLHRLSHLSSKDTEQYERMQVVCRTAVADQEIRQGMKKPRLSKDMLSRVNEALANRDLESVDSEVFIEAGLGDYGQQLRNIARGRRPMLSSKGRIGIVPSEAEPGDLVFVVLGADVPYIFRPRLQDGVFLLIGEAYVHGVMDGEATRGDPHVQTVEIG